LTNPYQDKYHGANTSFMKKFLSFTTAFFSYSFMWVKIALADFTIGQPPNTGVRAADNVNANNTISAIISNAIAILFTVAAVAFVFMIIWGAFQWITSGGDKEALGKARGRLTNALIGILILALAFVIIQTVGQIIGLNPLGSLSLPNIGSRLTPQSQVP
jgi:hypothetical protein